MMLAGMMLAQGQKERRVYYLDCSYSMVEPNKIWDKVCDNLKNAIDQVQDQTTELYIVPFAYDSQFHNGDLSQKEVHATATEAGKARLKAAIDALGTPGKSTMTYHPDPILDFYGNHRVAGEGWITYMFFMTDGQDEYQDKKAFLKELDRWRDKFGTKDVYGFNVMLHESAVNQQVVQKIEELPHFWNVQSAAVDIRLTRAEKRAVINVRNEEWVDVPLTGDAKGFDIEATMDADEDYALSNHQISDGKLRLTLKCKKDQSALPDEKRLTVNLKVNRTPNQFAFWVTDRITLVCKCKKEPAITNVEPKVDFGEVTYYPSCLWVDADTTSVTRELSFEFNADAKQLGDGAMVEFEMVDTEGKSVPADEVRLSIDGRVLAQNRFSVTASQPSVTLTLTCLDKAESGKHQGTLRLVNHKGLERIGACELADDPHPDVMQWRLRYNVDWNPLSTCLFWLGILIGALLLLWFLVIKPAAFKVLKINVLVINEPYFSQVRVKGALRVVCTAVPHKQSFWHRVFVGKIVYVVNETWQHEWSLLPMGRGAMMSAPNHYVDPLDSPLEPGTEYKMVDCDDKALKAVVSVL